MRRCIAVAEIFSSAEVTGKIETVEPKEQQTVVQKAEQAGDMLQAVPRVPVAGVKRRWGNRHTGSLQESSPEVSSSGVLSPPPNFQPSTPESAAVKNEELQLWDLDLHRGLQTNGDHYRTTITATTTTTVLPTVTDPASPFTTPVEGLCSTLFVSVALRKRTSATCTVYRVPGLFQVALRKFLFLRGRVTCVYVVFVLNFNLLLEKVCQIVRFLDIISFIYNVTLCLIIILFYFNNRYFWSKIDI